MGIPLETIEYPEHGGGLDLVSSPTKTPEEKSTSPSKNCDYDTDGAVRTRNGSTRLNSTRLDSGAKGTALLEYKDASGAITQIMCNSAGTIKHSLSNPVDQITGLSLTARPCMDYLVNQNDEYAVWGNGTDDNRIFDGTSWYLLNLTTPANPTTAVVNPGAGALATGTYQYFVTFAITVGGVIIQEGDISTGVSETIMLGDAPANIALSAIPVSTDPRVNARVIYRISPTSIGVAYRHHTIANNVDVTWTDTILEDGTIEAEYDNQAAPKSAVFCEFNGSIIYRDEANLTDWLQSKLGEPWSVPETSRSILDSKINCIKKLYNCVVFGTERSIWVLDENNSLRRISSKIGILNNRCFVGDTAAYFMGTNKKVYRISPTELQQDEMDISEPISTEIESVLSQINEANRDEVCMQYYTRANTAKLFISFPQATATNNAMFVFNEQQSIRQKTPVWYFWDNKKIACMSQFTINNDLYVIGCDYNGFNWIIDDPRLKGDGAEENGIVSSGTNNTLTDTTVISDSGTASAGGVNTLSDATKTWTVNEWQTRSVYIAAGTGAGQQRIVGSNTADTLTVTVAWVTPPDATSVYRIGGWTVDQFVGITVRLFNEDGEVLQNVLITANDDQTLTVSPNFTNVPVNTDEYSIGSYISQHFTNWRHVLGTYETLKRLWFIWVNANASGDYNIKLILQRDFDTSIANQVELLLNLQAENSIWGSVIWGEFIWGSRSVFLDRIKIPGFRKFRAIRLGFYGDRSGQPWQVNVEAISAQDKSIFWGP